MVMDESIIHNLSVYTRVGSLFFPDNGKQVFLYKMKIFYMIPHRHMYEGISKHVWAIYKQNFNSRLFLPFSTYLCDIWFLFAIFSTMNSMWIFLFFFGGRGLYFYVLFYWTLTMICFLKENFSYSRFPSFFILRCWKRDFKFLTEFLFRGM